MVRIEKSKIMVFRKGGWLPRNLINTKLLSRSVEIL